MAPEATEQPIDRWLVLIDRRRIRQHGEIACAAATHLEMLVAGCDVGMPAQYLFSVDADHPCGLDPGDIYISDNAGNMTLYADDVQDLRIAWTENDPVEVWS